MPSLFRIDKNSVTGGGEHPASVVVLPGFEDVVAHNDSIKEIEEVEETELLPDEEDEQETELERKRRELAALQTEIDNAQKQAEQLVAQARVQAESILEDARRQGYEEGLNQAHVSAMEERRKEAQATEEAIVALRDAKNIVFGEIEDSVLDLAVFIAEYIIKVELNKNDEVFLNIVRNTVLALKNQTNITIKVSKVEYERLFSDPDSEVVKELNNSGIQIRQDMSLKSGDCIVETEYGTINAGITTQLKRLAHALEGI
ncbi:MAG: FliH/SctL family protein [Christensenellaceae bacterium]|jgi:flagellar assembly protein FliH